MGRNKNIQKKAREEVLSVLGDEAKDVLPTKEDLKEMKYLDAVIKEVCLSPVFMMQPPLDIDILYRLFA